MSVIRYYSRAAFPNAAVETLNPDFEEPDLLLFKIRIQSITLTFSSTLFDKCD